MLSYLAVLALAAFSVSADTSPIHLVKHPVCAATGSPPLVNSGIDLTGIKTVYAFGDSWMANGQTKGGPAPPPVISGDNPKAGFRASDNYVWPEYFSQGLGATLKDYAIGGAMIDRKLWPSRVNLPTSTDMIEHVDTYLSQGNVIDAATTLCLISYGINDYAASSTDGPANLLKAADEMFEQIQRLVKSGLRKFVVVSPPTEAPALRQFDARVMAHVQTLKAQGGISAAYVEIISLFNALTATPSIFGYVDAKSCCPSQFTRKGACTDPALHVYYLPNHPATTTHSLIAQWVKEALRCPA